MTISPQPLVSVCIPLYNSRDFIGAAIESVLAQTMTDWELVITDDCSSDGSSEIVSAYTDPRIRYLRNPERLGAEGNWNRCVNEARGTYLKLLCHDDRLHPACLERQVAALRRPGHETVSLAACARRIINPAGRVMMVRRWKRSDRLIPGSAAIRQIVRGGTNFIGEPSAVLFRASDWKQMGGFSARHPYVIDLEFWIRLLERGDCFYLADPLCDFRVSAQSWSAYLAKQQGTQLAALIQDVCRRLQWPGSRRDGFAGRCKAVVYAALRGWLCRNLYRGKPGQD